jgi:hypothetical protein
MKSVTLFLLLAGCLPVATGCSTLVDPVAQFEVTKSCPSCSMVSHCGNSQHPAIPRSAAQRALEKVLVPEVYYRASPLDLVAEKLTEQTGISVTLALRTNAELKELTIPSGGRYIPLYEVLHWMCDVQKCELRITKRSAVLVECIDTETEQEN